VIITFGFLSPRPAAAFVVDPPPKIYLVDYQTILSDKTAQTVAIQVIPAPVVSQTTPSLRSKVAVAKQKVQTRAVPPTSGLTYGTARIISNYSYAYTNCYAWVASQRPLPITRNGNAGTTPTNTQVARVGEAAVMYGHIALVVAVQTTTVTVHEANYISGYLTERTLPKSLIYGYVL
jgi:surface antigen